MEPKGHASLPPELLSRLRQLEQVYLTSEDPIRQSGFGGGAERWRREREPILEAFQKGGDVLDTCCANGYLLESLRNWGRVRGLEIIPFGIDQGAKLIELARKRFPQFADHFMWRTLGIGIHAAATNTSMHYGTAYQRSI